MTPTLNPIRGNGNAQGWLKGSPFGRQLNDRIQRIALSGGKRNLEPAVGLLPLNVATVQSARGFEDLFHRRQPKYLIRPIENVQVNDTTPVRARAPLAGL